MGIPEGGGDSAAGAGIGVKTGLSCVWRLMSATALGSCGGGCCLQECVTMAFPWQGWGWGGGGQSAYPQKAPLTSLQPLSGRKQARFCSELLGPVLASSQEQTGSHACVLFLAHTLCLGCSHCPGQSGYGEGEHSR